MYPQQSRWQLVYIQEIHAAAKPEQRPRITTHKGKIKVFVPRSKWHSWTRLELMQNRPPRPFSRPLFVQVLYGMPRHATSRPDIDNLNKSILDLLVKAKIIKDDRLVVGLLTAKKKTAKPGVLVTIWEWSDESDDFALAELPLSATAFEWLEIQQYTRHVTRARH